MGRIGRSFQLVGQSYRVLIQDKELMVVPLISGVVIAIAVAGFAFGFGVDSAKLQERGAALYVPMFFLYVVTYSVAFCAWITLIAVSGLLAMLIGTPALALFAMGAVFLMVFFSALQGVYVASLYRYATDGQTTAGFDRALFDQAFVAKKP